MTEEKPARPARSWWPVLAACAVSAAMFLSIWRIEHLNERAGRPMQNKVIQRYRGRRVIDREKMARAIVEMNDDERSDRPLTPEEERQLEAEIAEARAYNELADWLSNWIHLLLLLVPAIWAFSLYLIVRRASVGQRLAALVPPILSVIWILVTLSRGHFGDLD